MRYIPFMTEKADRFEKIIVLDNKVEAGLLDSVLSERAEPVHRVDDLEL